MSTAGLTLSAPLPPQALVQTATSSKSAGHRELKTIMQGQYDTIKRSWDKLHDQEQETSLKHEHAVAELTEASAELTKLRDQYESLKKESNQLLFRCKVCVALSCVGVERRV